MSDYERYGDYDEVEEDLPKSKSPVLLILKILTAVVCIGVVGIIAFRLIVFSNYPDSVEDLYASDALKNHYSELGDDIKIKTQDLRAPYDDEDLGNFFCDYLYVTESIGEVQITVRYNTATVKRIAEERGIALDENSEELFDYRLVASYGEDESGNIMLKAFDNLSHTVYDKQVMYRYKKLVFGGIEFESDKPYWIRLEIKLKGDEWSEVPKYAVPIYENNEAYAKFDEYELSKSDKEELSK